MAELKVYNGTGWVTIANADAVPKALFDAHSILRAISDNTPIVLPVSTNQVVCRQSGNIIALSLTAQTVLLNDGGGLKALEVMQGNVLGKGVAGVLRSLTSTELLDIIIQDAALCKPHIAGRYYGANSPHGEATVGADRNDGPSGRIDGHYFFAMGDTIDTISVNCSTQDIGTNLRFLIYDVGSDGLPDALVYESGNISLTGTGVKTVGSVAQHLAPGWYFVAHYSDSVSTAAFEVTEVSYGLATVGLDAPTGMIRTMKKDVTFGSAPDPYGAPSIYSSNGPFRHVFTYV